MGIATPDSLLPPVEPALPMDLLKHAIPDSLLPPVEPALPMDLLKIATPDSLLPPVEPALLMDSLKLVDANARNSPRLESPRLSARRPLMPSGPERPAEHAYARRLVPLRNAREERT